MGVTALKKPRPLQHGARLAVISPASAPKPEIVEAGLAALRQWGYEPVLFPHAMDRGPIYYAGRIEDRVADIHAAFADKTIDGVIATRGGWGTAELLPYLDALLIRENAKPYIGYSDHSSLHVWFENEAGMVTFYAPMVASDFARADGVDERSWRACLEGGALSFTKADGLRVLRPGRAEGRVRGGCISILAESLGTPYAMRVDDGILFIEDVGTKPYQWDRMLNHMKLAGLLADVSGVVFGDMEQCVSDAAEAEQLEHAVLHALRDFDGPVAMGLRCGHVHGANLSLPLGVRAELDLTDAGNPQMHFVESGVAG